jgi:hypothetical protein
MVLEDAANVEPTAGKGKEGIFPEEVRLINTSAQSLPPVTDMVLEDVGNVESTTGEGKEGIFSEDVRLSVCGSLVQNIKVGGRCCEYVVIVMMEMNK